MLNLRWIGVLTLILMSAPLFQCSGEHTERAAIPGNPDEDFQMTMDAFDSTEDPEEKAALWLAFLERNPSNGYTVGTLQYLATQYYLGLKNDPDSAIAFLKIKLAHLQDPELAAEGQRLLIELMGEAGRSEELTELVRKLEGETDFTVEDDEAVYRASIAAGNWELVTEFSEAALGKLATMLEDSELDEDTIESIGHRRSSALMSLAWAKSNLGDDDEALALFEEAGKTAQFDYTGFSTWPTQEFDLYYGKALLKSGKAEEAIARLGPQGVILGDLGALDVLAEAYRAETGSSEGFTDFVEETRHRIARELPDFKMFDYDGKEVLSSDITGKATLLVFWFPT